MNKLLLKAIISTVLLLCTLLICISGAGLYFSDSGLVLGLPRYAVKNVHALSWLVMLCSIIPHFVLNLRLFVREWRGAGQGRRQQQHQHQHQQEQTDE